MVGKPLIVTGFNRMVLHVRVSVVAVKDEVPA